MKYAFIISLIAICTFADDIFKYAFYIQRMQNAYKLKPNHKIRHMTVASVSIFYLKTVNPAYNPYLLHGGQVELLSNF
jgi:hypothetical protein